MTVDGRPAQRQEFERQAPLGMASDTGDYTPYREISTLVHRAEDALLIVGFYRYGDAEGERAVRDAYDGVLASLHLEESPPPP